MTHNRHFKKIVCLSFLTLSASITVLAADKVRPNFVVLVADDWGFTDVGAFGGEIATPNLDELAQRGMRFSNFHVAASCAPTRSMLLTGVDNHRNGIGNLRETMPQAHLGKPGYLGSLEKRVVTVASLLKDSGYRTYITGKWNVGNEPYNRPDQRGFDRSIVQGDTGSDNWEPNKRYLPHAAKVNWYEDGKEAVMPAEFYSSQYFVDKAIGYLEADAQSKKPFFAYLGFQANHVPVQAPQAFIDKYKGRYAQGWTSLRQARRDKAVELGLVPKETAMRTMSTTKDWQALSTKEKHHQAREMEVYAAMAEAMDHHVGRLVSHLKKSGQYDNTVFVFLSDNGAEASDYDEAQIWLKTQYTQETEKLGAKGAYGIPGPGWASASVSPLYTFKFYSGEGGIRVPLIISGVAGMPQNQIHHSLAHVTDIVPTLLELADVNKPGSNYKGLPIEPLQGSSLLPVLQGKSKRIHPADQAIGYELAGSLALFKGDLKLVKNMAPVGDGAWHLYDMARDPGETNDLQSQMPDVFKFMQADYAAYAKSNDILEMPEGYNPVRQVFINSIVNYWLPTYITPALVALLALLLISLSWIGLNRRRTQ